MNTRHNLLRLLITIIIGGASLVGLTWFNTVYASHLPVDSDFLGQWNAARQWVVEGTNPYAPQVAETAQKMAYGRLAYESQGEQQYAFVHPLYAMIFIAPFGPVDYPSARALWMTVIELALLGVGWLSIKISAWKLSPLGIGVVLLFGMLWYGGYRGVLMGHFAVVSGLFILAAIYLVQRKQDLDAGLLLALSSALPSLSFLVIIYALVWSLSARRGRLAVGMLGGIAFLSILSLVFLPDWPKYWVAQVLEILRNWNSSGSIITIVANTFPGISKPINIILYSASGLYIIFEWLLSWNKDARYFAWTALLTLAMTFLVAPGLSAAYFVVLLPAFFLLFRSWKERWGDAGQQSAWVLLFVLFFGLWTIYLLLGKGINEPVIINLLFPIVSLLSLWWSRWWTLHRPQILYEEYTG